MGDVCLEVAASFYRHLFQLQRENEWKGKRKGNAGRKLGCAEALNLWQSQRRGRNIGGRPSCSRPLCIGVRRSSDLDVEFATKMFFFSFFFFVPCFWIYSLRAFSLMASMRQWSRLLVENILIHLAIIQYVYTYCSIDDHAIGVHSLIYRIDYLRQFYSRRVKPLCCR